MLRGCLLSLAMLAGLIALYIYWLDQTLDRPESLWAGAVAGFLVLLCIGALSNGIRAWRDARRISAAQQLDVQLVEGRTATVCGTIHPIGEPLLAPFSHTPCIACEYDLTSQQKLASNTENENSGSDFAGFLMNPCVIRTPFRDVKLLGYPLLEGFSEQRLFNYTAAANARDFLLNAQFDDRTGLKLVSVLSVFGDVWSDDDGYVRKNIRIGKVAVDSIFPPELLEDIAEVQRLGLEDPDALNEEDDEALDEDDDLEDIDEQDEESDDHRPLRAEVPKMVEKRVHVGEKVCAIGVYDEVRGGLVPLSRGGKPNRLIRGEAEVIVGKSRGSAVANLFGGLVGLALIHLALLGFQYAYTHSSDVIRDRQQKAQAAVQAGDLEALAQIFRRGLDLNHQDHQGNTLLHLSRSPAVTWWLVNHGANVNLVNEWGNTPLIDAAREGLPEIARELLKGKADVNIRNRTNHTALEEAEERGFEDVAVLLRPAAP